MVGLAASQFARKSLYCERAARLASAWMISKGIVLKKQTTAMMIHPIIRFFAKATSPLVRFDQI